MPCREIVSPNTIPPSIYLSLYPHRHTTTTRLKMLCKFQVQYPHSNLTPPSSSLPPTTLAQLPTLSPTLPLTSPSSSPHVALPSTTLTPPNFTRAVHDSCVQRSKSGVLALKAMMLIPVVGARRGRLVVRVCAWRRLAGVGGRMCA